MSSISYKRPDLSNRLIIGLLIGFLVVAATLLWVVDGPAPSIPLGELVGAVGVVFLLIPLLFLLVKRGGFTRSPPAWFVAHVLFVLLGGAMIALHAGGGNLLSPPGLLLLLLLLLILHGGLLRAVLSKQLSTLFARSSKVGEFKPGRNIDKQQLSDLIQRKVSLLEKLDSTADEALFSPALKHWLRHPILSTRYQRLARKESDMIGARDAVTPALKWGRRLHMTAALLFYVGVLTHVVIVLFFAGYAADGGAITWWYITAWGG